MCWSMAILQTTTKNVLLYKPSCALSGLPLPLHLPHCPIPYCCVNYVALSSPTLISCGLPYCLPLASHLCLLPSLSSDLGFTCSPSHCFLIYHRHLASASFLFLIIPQFEALLPHLPLLLQLFSLMSHSISLFHSPTPHLSPCVCSITFSGDHKCTYLCVDAENVCLPLFYT